MKKKVVAVMAICVLCTALVSFSFGETDSNIVFEGYKYSYKNKVYSINDMLYVPLRETFEMMGIPVEWNETSRIATVKMCDKEIDTDNKKADGVIANEKTAYSIGKIILEEYIGRPLEYENDIGVFYLETVYREKTKTWLISQECKFKNGGGGGIGFYSPTIILDRNTGEVLSLYTNPHFSER